MQHAETLIQTAFCTKHIVDFRISPYKSILTTYLELTNTTNSIDIASIRYYF